MAACAQRCDDCSTFVHPPVPICPTCRSRAWTPTAVSGRATVIRVHREPPAVAARLRPPYVLANVALDDARASPHHQPGRRRPLDPDAAFIGQVVEVRFRAGGGRVVPLFAPTGEVVADVDPVPTPTRPSPPAGERRPLRAQGDPVPASDGRPWGGACSSTRSRSVDACLTPPPELDDIDGLSTLPGPGAMGMSEGGVTAVEEALRLRPTWINGGMDLPAPAARSSPPMLAVAAGLCRHVLVFRTVEDHGAWGLRTGRAGAAWAAVARETADGGVAPRLA